jgi:hypothetical protein
MKLPILLTANESKSHSHGLYGDRNNKHQITPATWASVGGVWGVGNVILHDAVVCTLPGDHVTCLPTGVCHATTSADGCSAHYNNTGLWDAPAACATALMRIHVQALWNDFNANYTGRRQ